MKSTLGNRPEAKETVTGMAIPQRNSETLQIKKEQYLKKTQQKAGCQESTRELKTKNIPLNQITFFSISFMPGRQMVATEQVDIAFKSYHAIR